MIWFQHPKVLECFDLISASKVLKCRCFDLISASEPVLQGLPRRLSEDVEKRRQQEVDDERWNVLLQLKTKNKNKKQKINFGLLLFRIHLFERRCSKFHIFLWKKCFNLSWVESLKIVFNEKSIFVAHLLMFMKTAYFIITVTLFLIQIYF